MTEDQTTWKGHTFTLLVFTGIVVLCSIFFILGMLVGRQQGQKYASVTSAAAKNDAKTAPKEDKQDFTFYDSVKKEDQLAFQPAPPPPRVDPDPQPEPPPTRREKPMKEPAPAPKRPPVPQAAPAPSSTPSNVVNFQVGAVRKASDAQKLLAGLKKKGFRAYMVEPQKGDSNPLYRVQVGPFADVIEAEQVKKKLEKENYQIYLKK
jgi:cell division septation protein DedD